MSLNWLAMKLKRKSKKLKALVGYWLFIYPRKCKYRFLSTCPNVLGKPLVNQPLQLSGSGDISFGKNVNVGYEQSPGFYSGYTFIDARSDSRIEFGDGIWLNNSCSFIASRSGISVGDECLFGPNCSVFDSDFHDLDPCNRHGEGVSERVIIRRNVFVGANVTILKGVEIGQNSVIASGSVVVRSIPENVIAGGVPAKVLGALT
jgi:galactoside O-acetyltransferase